MSSNLCVCPEYFLLTRPCSPSQSFPSAAANMCFHLSSIRIRAERNRQMVISLSLHLWLTMMKICFLQFQISYIVKTALGLTDHANIQKKNPKLCGHKEVSNHRPRSHLYIQLIERGYKRKKLETWFLQINNLLLF